MAWTSQVREFGKEAWAELGKVSWPSRNELIDSTVVVIGTVIIVTVFVYVVDWLLRLGVGLLLH